MENKMTHLFVSTMDTRAMNSAPARTMAGATIKTAIAIVAASVGMFALGGTSFADTYYQCTSASALSGCKCNTGDSLVNNAGLCVHVEAAAKTAKPVTGNTGNNQPVRDKATVPASTR
jgi:hypothetical protein